MAELHARANLHFLGIRREMHLLSMMYDLNIKGQYIKLATANTRQGDKIVFNTEIVRYGLYRHSPYYTGAAAWSKLARDVQIVPTKQLFKNMIKNRYRQ